jgi:hypothetical protein
MSGAADSDEKGSLEKNMISLEDILGPGSAEKTHLGASGSEEKKAQPSPDCFV